MRDHVYGNTFSRLKITKVKSFSTLENGVYRITGKGVPEEEDGEWHDMHET